VTKSSFSRSKIHPLTDLMKDYTQGLSMLDRESGEDMLLFYPGRLS